MHLVNWWFVVSQRGRINSFLERGHWLESIDTNQSMIVSELEEVYIVKFSFRDQVEAKFSNQGSQSRLTR